VDRWNPIRTSAMQSRSRPMRFLGFSDHEKGAPWQETPKLSTVCSTFSRSGWGVVRSASLAKGGTSKKRPSPHLHKVLTRSNEVSPRTLQTAIVQTVIFSVATKYAGALLWFEVTMVICTEQTPWNITIQIISASRH
jgi:hypothetical protein